jgi:thiamine-phosphate pyrophosphorylase
VKLPDPPLLVITDRRQAKAPLEDLLAAAFGAGCRWASIREKDLPPPELAALAQRLLPVARAAGARLTLHGDAEQALALGLDGVHLPAGGDPARARKTLGVARLVGISVHEPDEARGIDPAAVDYIIAGPAFETASKPDYGPFLRAQGMASICGATAVPVIAIGGVSAHNIPDMKAAGVAGVSVMGGIMRANDPAAEARRLLAALRA